MLPLPPLSVKPKYGGLDVVGVMEPVSAQVEVL